MLLLGMAAKGYQRLTGSDYSAAAVDLASAVLKQHGQEHVELVVQPDIPSLASL